VTKIFSSGVLDRQKLVAVDDFSMRLPSGKPLAVTVAGESGSGKTTLAQMVLGFLPPTSGGIYYKGNNIRDLSMSDFTNYRREVQAVFQNPYDVFNPFYRVDHVFDMAIRSFHLASSKTEAKQRVLEALAAVRLVPEETLGRYPHQLSGGQLQRLMIARALLLKPRVIIADEPVSMIDVSLRAIILDILVSLRNEFDISFLYITHDLSTALQISDEIFILYKGSITECGDAAEVIQHPKHPYTQLLVQSIPVPDPAQKWTGSLELSVKNEAGGALTGCKFFDRCPVRMEICLSRQPDLYQVGEGQQAACFRYQ
jgi:peptide/nickel transport system ATP-binding protein